MPLRKRVQPMLLIAAGLFGMLPYAILTRSTHPSVLTSDSMRGLWIGVCIGLEVVGLSVLLKTRLRQQM